MKNILVLFGGVSSEHDVSCVSAASVIANIPRDSYNVYMLGITKNGEWLLYEGDPTRLEGDAWTAQSEALVKAMISADRRDRGFWYFAGRERN